MLLYAITLGTLELRNFICSLEHQSAGTLDSIDMIEQTLDWAESATSYFWFLGANPHAYDTWKARNQAAFRELRAGSMSELPPEPGTTFRTRRIRCSAL